MLFNQTIFIGEYWGSELKYNTPFRMIKQTEFHSYVSLSGTWGRNGPEGKIKEQYSDGTVWTGSYSNGLKNGKGIYKFADGTEQEGTFKNG